MDGQYWKGDRTMSTNEWLLTSDFWQFLEPWHDTKLRIRNFYCFVYRQHIWLENERWLLGDMIDHVGIYGSRVAEGLSASNVGLVVIVIVFVTRKKMYLYMYSMKRIWPQPCSWMHKLLATAAHTLFSTCVSLLSGYFSCLKGLRRAVPRPLPAPMVPSLKATTRPLMSAHPAPWCKKRMIIAVMKTVTRTAASVPCLVVRVCNLP